MKNGILNLGLGLENNTFYLSQLNFSKKKLDYILYETAKLPKIHLDYPTPDFCNDYFAIFSKFNFVWLPQYVCVRVLQNLFEYRHKRYITNKNDDMNSRTCTDLTNDQKIEFTETTY